MATASNPHKEQAEQRRANSSGSAAAEEIAAQFAAAGRAGRDLAVESAARAGGSAGPARPQARGRR
ncbi:hypothetical protein AB0C84_35880 [Actinomadura sp. NPDC048955]|uniref:hypothetical protein n=1 Tax=Actinomadura sp. NPDC048955 TaxID=3158228 RepID=UPI0033D550F2